MYYVRGEVEDVKHFLIRCDVFGWERQRLVERIGRMEGTQECLEEYWRAEEEGTMVLLLRGRCGGYGRSTEVVTEFEAEVRMVEILTNLGPCNPPPPPPPPPHALYNVCLHVSSRSS